MPDHWQETTLDSLIALTIGGVWGADPGEDEVDVPVYRQTEFDDAGRLHQPAGAIRSITYRQLASRTLEENDVLIQKSAGTPTLPGRVVLVPELSEASSFSNFLNLIRADRQAVEPVFLFLLLQHLHATKVAFEFQRGTNIRNLDLKSYLATTLLVPPLQEQRRIVDLVGSIDTYIDSVETQIETTRTARSALLSELLSNPGDDWQETTLGEIADWFAGGTPKATNPAFYADGQIPWAVIADLLNDPVVETAKQINEDGLNAIGGRLAPVGSILVSMYGTIARTAIAGVPLATNQAIAWAEPHSDACDGGFLRLLVDRLQPAFESAARGAAQKNINRGMIKDAGVLLPPLAEQRQILDLIGSIDEQISSLESQVESVRALRSGVLSELLSGERLLDDSYDRAVGL